MRTESDARRRKKRRHRQKYLPMIVALILIVIVALAGFGGDLFGKLMPEIAESGKDADLNAYYGLSEGGGELIILDHQALEERGVLQNGTVFIPMTLANEWEEIFYYDSNEDLLLATTADAVHTAQKTEYLTGAEQPYLSIEWVRQFVNLTYEQYTNPDRIVITTKWEAEAQADVIKKTYLRTKADKKAETIEELPEGETVTILSADELFSYAQTENGHLGYLDNKKLDNHREETKMTAPGVVLPEYNGNTRPYPVVLGWHNVASREGNATLRDAISGTKGMNVISPTWFAVSGEDGSLESFADSSYVADAHAAGLEVWGLVDNMSFPVDSNALLSHTTSRTALERHLIENAVQYGLDGINIDFEQLPGEAGDDFAQFLRELSILCRQQGLVLSVDNYVPKEYTNFYRRDIQGRVCDYVIIMGYDEHTNASGEAGSVASIDFVTEGIENTLMDVPANKVINAIPFYTRRWITENGSLSSVAVGMAEAQAFLRDHGQTAVWDDVTCQNVCRFESDGAEYSIWIEDAQSISAKLSVMKNHQLGGVACWRLMLETPDIWDVINAYFPVNGS